MTSFGYHGRIVGLIILGLILSTLPALAWRGERPFPFLEAPLPPVIGQIRQLQLTTRDSLMELARQQGLGFANLVAANPTVDPWLPKPEHPVLLPTAIIPPAGLTEGITINLAEMRLYLVQSGEAEPRLQVFPIGIGRSGLATPEGRFQVTTRVVDPVWKVPQRILDEEPGHRPWVKAGPDNPLGNRWLGLSLPGYGIHGTNRPFGIGRRVSSGCIRLYPRDILRLFEGTPVGTPVTIVYQPLKIGRRGDRLYMVAHPDFEGRTTRIEPILRQALRRGAPEARLDWRRIDRELERRSGLPVPIGILPKGAMASSPPPSRKTKGVPAS